MTIEEMKNFLKKPSECDKMIKILKKELQQRKKELDNLNIVYSETKAITTKSIVEQKILKILELEEDIKKYERERNEVIKEIRGVINKLDNETYRKILELRYLDSMSWDKIEKILNYSEQHLHRLHNQALNEILNKLKYVSPC